MGEEFYVWVEVDCEVVVVEKGTRLIRVRVPKYYDQCSLQDLNKYIDTLVKRDSHEIFDDEDFMMLDKLQVEAKVVRAYTENGSGEPNLGNPIELGD